MARIEDIQHVAVPVLTHRVITTFAAQAERVWCQRDCGEVDSRDHDRSQFMITEQKQRSFLDPKILAKLGNLPLKSRRSNAWSSIRRHTSPHRGASVEFAEYRKYVPGDDLRRLDWRAIRPFRSILREGIGGRHQTSVAAL